MIKVYFDGACEPVNPGGTAAYGVIIFSETEQGASGGFEDVSLKELFRESLIVAQGRDATNNVAEYSGLLRALRWLQKNNFTSELIHCFGDSRLVIYQMSEDPETGKKWQMRPGPKPYKAVARKCQELVKEFKHIKFSWVSREKNIADVISKKALKDKGIVFKIQPE